MQEHHIEVRKTARYYTLGNPSPDIRTVGFFCHGYRQLGGRFLSQLTRLDDGHRLLVAPEGLHRFYVEESTSFHGKDSRIGASWMTAEDRAYEISDYVAYLDQVYERIFESVDRTSVNVVAVGFSQGAAAVARWVASGRARVDRTVLWSGLLPPDLDVEGFRRNMGKPVALVMGRDDELISKQLVRKAQEKMQADNILYDLIEFEGGHRLDLEVMERVVLKE
ncbi:MAG: dienelactone hydrolase family protein [bacterium]|nr:dienelactone hydrolase family protein [bacterium]